MKASFFLLLLSLPGLNAFTQQPYNWSDSTKPGSKYSHLNLDAGIGNNFFRAKQGYPKNAEYSQLYYSFEGRYYHKSGLSLSIHSFSTKDKNSLVLYQALVKAAYDYERYNYQKRWGLGFGGSYIRLLNKDSVSFYQSPLKNQVSAYFKWMNRLITPRLSFSYGSGKGNVHEYNLNLNLLHTIYLTSMVDDLRKTDISVSLFAGKNPYGGLNPLQRKVVRVSDASFGIQDILLAIETTYSIGKSDFYIRPNIIVDYYPKEYSRWYPMFNFGVGYEFW